MRPQITPVTRTIPLIFTIRFCLRSCHLHPKHGHTHAHRHEQHGAHNPHGHLDRHLDRPLHRHERREHLTKLLEREKEEAEAEERARAKSKGMGGFLSHEQKKVFGGSGGLEERIRRGRGQMRVDAD